MVLLFVPRGIMGSFGGMSKLLWVGNGGGLGGGCFEPRLGGGLGATGGGGPFGASGRCLVEIRLKREPMPDAIVP